MVLRVLLISAAIILADQAIAVTFADGGIHIVSDAETYPFESVEVRDGVGGAPTALSVVGGQIGTFSAGSLTVFDSSEVNVSGGLINQLFAEDESIVEVSGGQIGLLRTMDTASLVVSDGRMLLGIGGNSTVEISGGSFLQGSEARGSSTVIVHDGTFLFDFILRDNAIAEIRGGTFTNGPGVTDFAVLHIFGGVIGPSIFTLPGQTPADPRMIIYGSGFNFPFGDLSASSGMLTGTLADGTPLNTSFIRQPGTTITLAVPEAGCGPLLGVGLVAWQLLRRREDSC